jgi:hypothetical protein
MSLLSDAELIEAAQRASARAAAVVHEESSEMEVFDVEMENASSELISYLAIYLRRRNAE